MEIEKPETASSLLQFLMLQGKYKNLDPVLVTEIMPSLSKLSDIELKDFVVSCTREQMGQLASMEKAYILTELMIKGHNSSR